MAFVIAGSFVRISKALSARSQTVASGKRVIAELVLTFLIIESPIIRVVS